MIQLGYDGFKDFDDIWSYFGDPRLKSSFSKNEMVGKKFLVLFKNKKIEIKVIGLKRGKFIRVKNIKTKEENW